MTDTNRPAANIALLSFHGGVPGAMAPLAFFLCGVAWLGLSGAPDERGLWPVLLGALTICILLAKDRSAYADAVIAGMSRPIVMLMVTAWLLAGVLGAILTASGFVDALVSLARVAHVSGGGFVAVSFVVCAVIATSTGTSLGTLIVAAPLLYPAGVELSASPVFLIGAILGGATFGDNVSPISDTTIASASTQGAELGLVVRSRMQYALPAAALAIAASLVFGAGETTGTAIAEGRVVWASMPMLAAPIVVLTALLTRRHLVEGIVYGIVAGIVIALVSGTIEARELLYVDREAFIARGIILTGMERGVGVSVFTVLLMGLVGGIEATGLVDRAVGYARTHMRSKRSAEAGIFAAVSAAVLLTTHSTVAVLTVGPFARDAGALFGVPPCRRANILDVTVCTYPFLLPFFVPTILAASLTSSSTIARVPALHAGLANFYSWGLLGALAVALVTGWGTRVENA